MSILKRYRSREHAGQVLAAKIRKLGLNTPYLLGIPRGGIEIAEPVSEEFNIPINPIITKKIPIPYSPETGFGAITEEGDRIFNQDYLSMLNFSEEEIEAVCKKVIEEIKHRIEIYGNYDKGAIKNSDVIVVDDGAATGYSLIAALISLKKYNPASITAAIPVSSMNAYHTIKKYCDNIVCPIIDESFIAVGYYYEEWHDLNTENIVDIIKKSKKKG